MGKLDIMKIITSEMSGKRFKKFLICLKENQ